MILSRQLFEIDVEGTEKKLAYKVARRVSLNRREENARENIAGRGLRGIL